MRVGGFPWLSSDYDPSVPPRALAAHVLCSRHNASLSGLDRVGIKVFSALDRMNREFGDDVLARVDWALLVNGHDFERWLLKVVCGLVFSENATTSAGVPLEGVATRRWLRLLFGLQPFPKQWGLYFHGGPGHGFAASRGVTFQILHRDRVPFGAVLGLNAFAFTLNLAPIRSYTRRPLLEESTYRPTTLSITDGRGEKTIAFGWRGGGGGGLNIRFHPSA
jgi:hypothetical protein